MLVLVAALAPVLAPPGRAADDSARIDAVVLKRLQAPGAVGLSVAVSRGGKLVYSRAHGFAALEFPVNADEETLFRIASITKTFTAAAILELSERGKLALDDPLTQYLPDYPTHGQEVTLRHLLTHTAGIPNVTDLGRAWSDQAARELRAEEMLALWKDRPLDFAPGERWHYSNSGYYLLGLVIEKVSGQSYDAFLRAAFFEPLGMKRTRLDSNGEVIANRAQGYAYEKGAFRNDRLIAMSQPFSSGALLSTAGDLVRWFDALASGRVLDPATFAEMRTPYMLAGGAETTYGMGLSLEPMAGHPCVSHGGDIFGFNSWAAHFPERDGGELTIAALSNSEAFSTQALVEELARALLADAKEPSGG